MLNRLTQISVLLASAMVATAATASDPASVLWIPGATLRAQIGRAAPKAKGNTWIDYVRSANGSVLVVRRSSPGRAEVHTRMIDVWYVIDGRARLVTGGILVDEKRTDLYELRGKSVSGGVGRQIGPGDLIEIPAGMPHWVAQIDGKELVYLAVKIAGP